jgi:uncharacterized protein (TIGR03083 family)
MELEAYLEQLRADADLIADVVADVGPDAAVPTCPEWRLRDLIWHLGGVQRWATTIVATPIREPYDVELEEVVGQWPADSDLASWFVDGAARLVDTLASAPPHLDCWTFLAAESPRAMWSRRQAHESAIHRLDAELSRANTDLVGVAAAFAADGVDELLTSFIVRPKTRLRSAVERTLAISCTDRPESWLVRIANEPTVTARRPDASATSNASCAMHAPASILYEVLWSRRPIVDVAVTGDASVAQLFVDSVHVRW